MEFSLGVSMTPTAVRLVLIEGATADGATVDHFDLAVANGAAEQVVAAILGTRESVEESGYRLVSTGVAWTDHAAAAELRRLLRTRDGDAGFADSVVLVSELHAAGSLAQAIGRAVGYERTALMFLNGTQATLAVVRTADGAVVRVHTRGVAAGDPALRDMVGRLDDLDEPPQALYLIGTGPEAARLRTVISAYTSLPVHAPDDAELALARGAALASASAPRWEAATVGIAPGPATQEDTQAAVGLTERAGAAYMAPLGYSAVSDDPAGLEPELAEQSVPGEPQQSEPKHFLLVGSALAALFVVGLASLVISLAVTIRPAVQQRPDPGSEPVTNSQTSAPDAAGVLSPSIPETIQAPIPVVREAPRTVFVTPAPVRTPAPTPAPAAVPAREPAAPAPAPAVEPAPAPAPVAAQPAPAPVPAPVPVPVPVPVPIVVPILPPLLPQFPTAPVRRPARTPSTAPSAPQATLAPQASIAAPAAPVTSVQPPVVPESGSGQSGSGTGQSGPTQSGTGYPQNPLWPYWPVGR